MCVWDVQGDVCEGVCGEVRVGWGGGGGGEVCNRQGCSTWVCMCGGGGGGGTGPRGGVGAVWVACQGGQGGGRGMGGGLNLPIEGFTILV